MKPEICNGKVSMQKVWKGKKNPSDLLNDKENYISKATEPA